MYDILYKQLVFLNPIYLPFSLRQNNSNILEASTCPQGYQHSKYKFIILTTYVYNSTHFKL